MKRFRLIKILSLLLIVLSLNTAELRAQEPVLPGRGLALIDQLRQETHGALRISYDSESDNVRFMGTVKEQPIHRAAGIASITAPEQAAREFLKTYGQVFGLQDQAAELRVMRMRNADQDRVSIHFQQVESGVPLMGGELVVNLDHDRNVLSANGQVLPQPKVDITPALSAATARRQALTWAAQVYDLQINRLTATDPQLWIYNPKLLSAPGANLSTLVWRLEVQSIDQASVREVVLIDAHRGGVTLHINQAETAMNRQTYTANNTTSLPGTLVCNENNPSCNGGDAHAVAAHRYAADTYNFYFSRHARDSINNTGMTLISTVHYSSTYYNAQWNGSQMLYGDARGYALADDVVGHEFTHGVTQYESNLVYQNESGAINESLSDVFGEFIDLTNGAGNDSAAVRWLIGEDITGPGGGAIRNMANPPQFGDPDRMSSSNFYVGVTDYGGVHTNSGVNNKAAYLMVDGDTFNGTTVSGIGLDKVEAIYYEAQTNLLTSGSNYHDLADVLQQACNNLIGTVGITAADCQQVANAIAATEMHAIHVSTTGSDLNDCLSTMRPCRTITMAVVKAASGDPISIAPGTYLEHPLTISKLVRLAGNGVVIQ
jgi:bacillolysin